MKRLFILTILFFPLLNACKKDGCGDSLASNYIEGAKKNDPSCTYHGSVSFWFNQSMSNSMITLGGVTGLTIFIDEISSGTMDPADWKIGPDCGGANFTISVDLGGTESKLFDYAVRDQNGALKFSGQSAVGPNECQNIQLM